MGHLTVLTGCMFAQKTTELLRHIRRYRSIGHQVLVLNHALDVRYGGGNSIVTHNEVREEAVMASRLSEVNEMVCSGTYSVVAIDEGQFFPDLFEYVTKWADECAIHIIVAGLDGTFERHPFGDILRLIPHAEEVIRLSALCSRCRDGTKAVFSCRTNQESGGDIVVGAAEAYEPVCRRHYRENKGDKEDK